MCGSTAPGTFRQRGAGQRQGGRSRSRAHSRGAAPEHSSPNSVSRKGTVAALTRMLPCQ